MVIKTRITFPSCAEEQIVGLKEIKGSANDKPGIANPPES